MTRILPIGLLALNACQQDPKPQNIVAVDCFDQVQRDEVAAKNPTHKTVYVPVHFIDIAASNKGSSPWSKLNNIISSLNESFLNAGVQFYIHSEESVQTLDINDQYLNGTTEEQANEIYLEYGLKPKLNIIIATEVLKEGVGAYCKNCPDEKTNDDYIVMAKDSTLELYIHEVGHFLGLDHTFKNYNSHNEELVDGSNCQEAGDRICDTPTDPGKNPENETYYCELDGCEVLSCPEDNNGDQAKPDTSNYMSYYNFCRDSFTPEQYEVMACYARTEQSYFTKSQAINNPLPTQNKVTVNCDENSESDFESALVKVNDGGTVELCEGSYELSRSFSEINLTIQAREGHNVYLTNESNMPVFEFMHSDISLSGLTFSNSVSSEHGSAVSSLWGNLTIDNCTFINNKSLDYGGAIYISLTENVDIKNSSFYQNSTESLGGAIHAVSTEINLNNVSFTDNSSQQVGGAIYLGDDTTLFSEQVTFSGNQADEEGGAIFLYSATSVLTDTIIQGNRGLYGADALTIKRSNVTIRNGDISNHNTAITLEDSSNLELSDLTWDSYGNNRECDVFVALGGEFNFENNSNYTCNTDEATCTEF